jgi:hypothetical protein
MFKYFITIVAIAVMQTTVSHAQFTTTAGFLPQSQGARALALGESYVACWLWSFIIIQCRVSPEPVNLFTKE